MSKSQEDRKKEKVEAMGVFFEKSGYTPMMGRVFAYLLLAEPPYQPFDAITEFLVASKSAISNALNFLMKQNMVDYVTFSGDRKRYFRVNMVQWMNQTKTWSKQVTEVNGLLKEVLEERADTKHPKFNDGLQEMIDMNEYFAKGLEEMLAKWEAKGEKN